MRQAQVDDPTCRLERKRTARLGLSAYAKANVLSFRCTDSKKLLALSAEYNLSPPRNLAFIRAVAADASLIVMACGVLPKPLQHHARTVIQALRDDGRHLTCLGTTKEGWPRHPLYVADNVAMLPYGETV